jgi:hypothetical protein
LRPLTLALAIVVFKPEGRLVDSLRMTLPPPRRRLRDRLAAVAFALWVPAIVIPGVYLMAGHVLALPTPDRGDARLLAVLAADSPADQGHWRALHFLDESCGCSQRILASLLARRPLSGLQERIVFVSRTLEGTASARAAARAAGFGFEEVASEELEPRFGVEAVPMLVAVAPGNEARYTGGYTDRKQGPAIQDRSVLLRVMNGERLAALPVFGCAVSKRLAAELDPLRLK